MYNVASNLMDLGPFLANKLQKSSEGKEDGCSAVTSKEAVHSTTISVEVFICYRFEVMLYILRLENWYWIYSISSKENMAVKIIRKYSFNISTQYWQPWSQMDFGTRCVKMCMWSLGNILSRCRSYPSKISLHLVQLTSKKNLTCE